MRVGAAALALCFVAGAAATAHAQESEARVEARGLGEKGDGAFGAGRCDKAIGFWRRADAVFHAPTLLLRIARCEALLGHVVDATGTLEKIVAEPLPASAPPAWSDARIQAAAELPGVRGRIARLDVHVSTAAGTSPVIQIDDAPLVSGERGAPVDPGAHRVLVRVGEATAERHVTLDDGEERSVSVSVAVETPRPKARTQRTAGLVLGGVGLVALGVGVGFGVSAVSTSSHLDDLCGPDHRDCPPSQKSAIDRTGSNSLIADFALGGGAALALTGGLLLLTDTSAKKEQPRVRVLLSRGILVAGPF